MSKLRWPVLSAVLVLLVLAACAEPPPVEPTEEPSPTVQGTMSAFQQERQPKPGEALHITVQWLLVALPDDPLWHGPGAPPLPTAAKDRTFEQARTLAYDLLGKAKNGADFDSLVKQYGDLTTYPGIYSYANYGVTTQGSEISRDKLTGSYSKRVKIAFGLKPGEVAIIDWSTQRDATEGGFTLLKRLK
jgi:hypothetical protein